LPLPAGTQVVLRLLDAGACTSTFYPAHGATPSDWAQPLSEEKRDINNSATDLYTIFVTYRLTGLV
jgi:hypothetical protein